MTLELVKYIFLFLLGTSVLNFAIAMLVRVKTKDKEFNTLLIYWPCIILTYIAAAVLSANPTQIAFAYFFQIFSSNLIVKIMCSAQGIKTRWPLYLGIQLTTMVISTYLLLYTNVGFTAALLPVSFGFTLPFIRPIWFSLVENRANSSWIEKAMGVVFLTGIVNHFNYAIFRLDPNAAFWGWSVSIAQYQCLSLFLPLLINHRREENEKANLHQVLQKLSGISSPGTMGLDTLYKNLELQILKKEEFSRLLNVTNTELEEERATNEVLIRTISHDIANPLMVITTYTHMLRSNRIPPQDHDQALERINSSCSSAIDMTRRIRDAILTRNHSKLVSMEPILLGPCLIRLESLFEIQLAQKQIKLKIENLLSPETRILAEENSLTEHVLANILSNAIKYSYINDSIIIKIREDQDFVTLEVRDFGTGMDLEKMKDPIFSSVSGTDGEKGTGFGLMVLGFFVRKFQGEFTILSSPPIKGTLVSLKLRKYNGPTNF